MDSIQSFIGVQAAHSFAHPEPEVLRIELPSLEAKGFSPERAHRIYRLFSYKYFQDPEVIALVIQFLEMESDPGRIQIFFHNLYHILSWMNRHHPSSTNGVIDRLKELHTSDEYFTQMALLLCYKGLPHQFKSCILPELHAPAFWNICQTVMVDIIEKSIDSYAADVSRVYPKDCCQEVSEEVARATLIRRLSFYLVTVEGRIDRGLAAFFRQLILDHFSHHLPEDHLLQVMHLLELLSKGGELNEIIESLDSVHPSMEQEIRSSMLRLSPHESLKPAHIKIALLQALLSSPYQDDKAVSCFTSSLLITLLRYQPQIIAQRLAYLIENGGFPYEITEEGETQTLEVPSALSYAPRELKACHMSLASFNRCETFQAALHSINICSLPPSIDPSHYCFFEDAIKMLIDFNYPHMSSSDKEKKFLLAMKTALSFRECSLLRIVAFTAAFHSDDKHKKEFTKALIEKFIPDDSPFVSLRRSFVCECNKRIFWQRVMNDMPSSRKLNHALDQDHIILYGRNRATNLLEKISSYEELAELLYAIIEDLSPLCILEDSDLRTKEALDLQKAMITPLRLKLFFNLFNVNSLKRNREGAPDALAHSQTPILCSPYGYFQSTLEFYHLTGQCAHRVVNRENLSTRQFVERLLKEMKDFDLILSDYLCILDMNEHVFTIHPHPSFVHLLTEPQTIQSLLIDRGRRAAAKPFSAEILRFIKLQYLKDDPEYSQDLNLPLQARVRLQRAITAIAQENPPTLANTFFWLEQDRYLFTESESLRIKQFLTELTERVSWNTLASAGPEIIAKLKDLFQLTLTEDETLSFLMHYDEILKLKKEESFESQDPYHLFGPEIEEASRIAFNALRADGVFIHSNTLSMAFSEIYERPYIIYFADTNFAGKEDKYCFEYHFIEDSLRISTRHAKSGKSINLESATIEKNSVLSMIPIMNQTTFPSPPSYFRSPPPMRFFTPSPSTNSASSTPVKC